MTFVGEIIEVPVELEASYKTQIKLEAQKKGELWQELNVTIIAYISKIDSVTKLMAGNKIILNAQLNPIFNKKNPFDFDYAKYLSLKNINQTVYLNSKDWKLLSAKEVGIKNHALNLRQKFLNEFEKQGIIDENLAILSALTLGYKNKLDSNIRDAYSGAGVMHVLAVSGLHVAIIYGVLNVLLSWISLFSKIKKLKYLIILFCLWFYAFLTGLSPSVMRAAIMFSFVLAGKLIDKKGNVYNSLAASAFFILLFNPLLLFDVGFQLSYIAVLGIVFFYPRINGWFYFKHKIIREIWAITAVSIAAQLVTFPLTVYHFHQFPSYFWLANIEVSLSAAALMLISIIFMALSAFPIITSTIAGILNFILKYNLIFIQWINDLPGAKITAISFSSVQVFSLYGSILIFAIWLLYKNYKALIIWLSCIIIFRMATSADSYFRKDQNALCVYQIKNSTAIQFIHQSKAIWISTQNEEEPNLSALIEDGNIFWKVENYNYYNISESENHTIHQKNWYYNSGFWATEQLNGLILNTNSRIPLSPKDSFLLDYIIVTGNPSFGITDLPDKIKYNNIIIDGSVPYWKAKQFIPTNIQVPVYHTYTDGAFIVHL